MVGLHYFFLQSKNYYLQSFQQFGMLPNIDYGQLLINRKKPQYEKDLNEINSNFMDGLPPKYQDYFKYKVYLKGSSPAADIFASMESLVEQTRNSNRSVKLLLGDYKFIVSSHDLTQLYQYPLIDLIYHLHLMSPHYFRTDCYSLCEMILHHVPYKENYFVFWIKEEKINSCFALSVELETNRLCLTKFEGKIKPHQKWIYRFYSRGRLIIWIDPKTSQRYNVISIEDNISLCKVDPMCVKVPKGALWFQGRNFRIVGEGIFYFTPAVKVTIDSVTVPLKITHTQSPRVYNDWGTNINLSHRKM